MSKGKVLGEKILIRMIDPEDNVGGLYVPKDPQAKPEGIVVMHGEGRLLESGVTIPVAVKQGDIVVIADHVGDQIMIENKRHRIIRENDILYVKES